MWEVFYAIWGSCRSDFLLKYYYVLVRVVVLTVSEENAGLHGLVFALEYFQSFLKEGGVLCTGSF